MGKYGGTMGHDLGHYETLLHQISLYLNLLHFSFGLPQVLHLAEI